MEVSSIAESAVALFTDSGAYSSSKIKYNNFDDVYIHCHIDSYLYKWIS